MLILGAGPGGLEAAIVASGRGHRVTIWEKSSRLGGNLIPASVPDFKDDLKRLIKYYETQIHKLGIELVLEKEWTPDEILAENTDVLIIATGSTPIMPRLPGIDGNNVCTAIDVLSKDMELGENIIVAGGGFVGCETAVHLAGQGLPCDSAVLALGFKAAESCREALEGKIKEIRVIGDASAPRRVKHAVAEGFEASISI